MNTECFKDHDAICCDIVEEMSNIGSIPYQFIYYATCYKSKNIVHYFVSENAERLYKFAAKKMEEDIFCIPVQRTSTSLIVPSGHKEELKQQYKLEAAKKLMEQSAGKVIDKIYVLAMPNNNVAEEIIGRIQEPLHGCFDDEVLQLYEGILEYTFIAKKISAINYMEYRQWLSDIRKDFEDERVIYDVHERIFTGFAYYDENGNIKYYYNAVESSTISKQKELQCKRMIVSPILKKRYCYSTMDELTHIATNFRNVLHVRLGAQYMKILRYIYNLPSSVNKNNFELSYQQAVKEKNLLLQRTLDYYGTLWHAW